MPATILDSAVFRDIFTTEAMRNVFSDENRVQKYLDFEAALARAQARLGIIPKEAAAEIGRHCSVDKIDMTKLKEATERIGYPVLPVGAAARETVQRRARRMVALGRDHSGYHRHRDHHADPRGARPRREGHRWHLRWLGGARRRSIATRPWPAAAIFNRRCRSRSATRWRLFSPPSSVTGNG